MGTIRLDWMCLQRAACHSGIEVLNISLYQEDDKGQSIGPRAAYNGYVPVSVVQ